VPTPRRAASCRTGSTPVSSPAGCSPTPSSRRREAPLGSQRVREGGVMKAVTVQPGVAGSVRFEDVLEPDESTGSILVEAVAVGICGTDVEIASGAYGWAPPGRERLILGHESLGRVVDPGPDAGLQPGDLVVGVVRARAFWEPRQVLVTGAGPIGMLAALIGIQHGLDVHVLDRVTEGAKPRLVHDLGATYHSGAVADVGFEPDVVIECTGVGSV